MSEDRLVDDGSGSGRGADVGDQRGASPGSNRGGGPRTVRGLERVERNLRPPGGSNFRHGIYTFKQDGIAPLCGNCTWEDDCADEDPDRHDPMGRCWRLSEFQENLANEIAQLAHIKPEDALMVRLLCKDVALRELIDLSVADREPDVPDSLAKERGACVNRIMRQLTELGLSPRSRAALKLTEGGGLLSQLMAVHEELDEERVAKAEETMEGQFELFDEAEEQGEPEVQGDGE